MSFNKQAVRSYSTGPLVPFTAPLAALKGTVVALNGVTAGSTASAAGLVIPLTGRFSVRNCALVANVETNILTTNLTATLKWQVSNDNTNWIDLYGSNLAANVQKAATGTGLLVTTQWAQAFSGINPAFPYIRLAVLVGGATGTASDSVTVSYNWRQRGEDF